MGQAERRHAPGRDPGRRRAARSRATREKLAFVTQTTLSVDDARARSSPRCRQRFPAIVGPKRDDICYATQNRQDAVKFWRRSATW